MYPKVLEGMALVIGMCLLMHALFSHETGKRSLYRGRAAYLLLGSSLLAYGIAEVMLRSIG